MMVKKSAGLLMYKKERDQIKVLIAHPGGPFFKDKDEGAWTIPKGTIKEGEEEKQTAIREFEEETGIKISTKKEFIDLGTIKLKSGKIIRAWAFEGEWNEKLESNKFKMEWPPRSGIIEEYPELDKAGFYNTSEARKKLNPAQAEFINRLEEKLQTT
jgi:predicted NUDIX family NTP pyrophosphohydrolase